jgi:Tfp pilus assembly protein PilF
MCGRRSKGSRDVNETLPTPHWLSLALGSAHFRNQDFRRAEEAYRAAVEVKPDLGEAHQNLAVVYMVTGRLDQAEREVELAEEAGLRVPSGLRKDIEKRRASSAQ